MVGIMPHFGRIYLDSPPVSEYAISGTGTPTVNSCGDFSRTPTSTA